MSLIVPQPLSGQADLYLGGEARIASGSLETRHLQKGLTMVLAYGHWSWLGNSHSVGRCAEVRSFMHELQRRF